MIPSNNPTEDLSQAAPPISVLLLHRYRILADSLCRLLRESPVFELAGVVTRPEQALAELEDRAGVEVLLFDIQSCCSPVRFVRELRGRSTSMKILPMSVAPEKEIVELIEAGACGYVPLDASLGELEQTICQVHRNQAPCCPLVVAAVLNRLRELSGSAAAKPAGFKPDRLSGKESRVLELLAQGCSNREIARHMGISLSTVKMHVRRVLAKLQVERRQDAVRVAAGLGLLKPVSGTLRRPA